MRQFLACIQVLTIALYLTACGKAEFGGSSGATDSKSTGLSTSAEENGDAQGQLHDVGDLIENPALAELYSCGNKKEKKVIVCHRPEGNPENAQTLCIGAPALDAHLDNHGEGIHQDTLGACPAVAQVEQPEESQASHGHSGNCSKKK